MLLWQEPLIFPAPFKHIDANWWNNLAEMASSCVDSCCNEASNTNVFQYFSCQIVRGNSAIQQVYSLPFVVSNRCCILRLRDMAEPKHVYHRNLKTPDSQRASHGNHFVIYCICERWLVEMFANLKQLRWARWLCFQFTDWYWSKNLFVKLKLIWRKAVVLWKVC